MSINFFGRRRPVPTFDSLYGAIVAQARRPAFYASLGVPDTLLGRFDMIVLHLALVNRRLRDASPELREAAQGVFDAFCRDMDDNLRELGIGDTGMAKRMRDFGAAFYGCAAAYDEGLASADSADLVAALARNVYGETTVAGPAPSRLAAYVRAADAALAAQDPRSIAAGAITFLDPAAIADAISHGTSGADP